MGLPTCADSQSESADSEKSDSTCSEPAGSRDDSYVIPLSLTLIWSVDQSDQSRSRTYLGKSRP